MWNYKNKEFTEEQINDYVGFVYQITNLINDKKYIGKKLFKFSRTKTVKGKKKKMKISSDWVQYYGSNEELKMDVKTLGFDKFKREILYLCKSKGECNYYEAYEQFKNRVLESDQYYNSWISVKVHKSHVKKD